MVTVSGCLPTRSNGCAWGPDPAGDRRAAPAWSARGGRARTRFPISRPAISQHLKVLKRANLVLDQPIGNRRLYTVAASSRPSTSLPKVRYVVAAQPQHRRLAARAVQTRAT